MSAEAITHALLAADAALAGLVGTRIFPVVVPDKQSAPALVHDVIVDVSVGVLNATQLLGTQRARVSLDAYAPDFDVAKAIQAAAERAVRFQRGLVAGFQLVAVEPLSKGSNAWDPDRQLFVCPAQVLLFWREP